MIINVPDENDFKNSGIGFINLALDEAFKLLHIIEDSGLQDWEAGEEEFWENAQIPLSNALVLIQQGIEFILKSKIAATSPYLLITSSPSDWPKTLTENKVSFSEFRTIDAQDLIKAHNTVCNNKLSDQFNNKFKELKNIRNKIIHSVDHNITIYVKDIITSSLYIFYELIGPKAWIEKRREYLYNTPISVAVSDCEIDETGFEINREINTIIGMLSSSELKKYFEYNTKQRKYYCPDCIKNLIDFDDRYIAATAQLRPNLPESISLYCFVCDSEFEVARNKCPNDKCKGNVIYEDDLCLTCLNY